MLAELIRKAKVYVVVIDEQEVNLGEAMERGAAPENEKGPAGASQRGKFDCEACPLGGSVRELV